MESEAVEVARQDIPPASQGTNESEDPSNLLDQMLAETEKQNAEGTALRAIWRGR